MLGSSSTLVVAPAIGGPKVSRDAVKCCLDVPVLVIVSARLCEVWGSATLMALVELASRPAARGFGVPFLSEMDNATFTAASESMSPAPCSNAGAEMSCAVLMMICLTKAGVGLLP